MSPDSSRCRDMFMVLVLVDLVPRTESRNKHTPENIGALTRGQGKGKVERPIPPGTAVERMLVGAK